MTYKEFYLKVVEMCQSAPHPDVNQQAFREWVGELEELALKTEVKD